MTLPKDPEDPKNAPATPREQATGPSEGDAALAADSEGSADSQRPPLPESPVAVPDELPGGGEHADDSSVAADETGDDVRHLLRGALSQEDATPPDVLGGFQRKLRQRSGGKFYADEWSTAREPPIATYLVTSLLMLVFLLFVFAFLRSLASEPAAAHGPEPVNVVPSPRKVR